MLSCVLMHYIPGQRVGVSALEFNAYHTLGFAPLCFQFWHDLVWCIFSLPTQFELWKCPHRRENDSYTWTPEIKMALKYESGAHIFMKYRNLTDLTFVVVCVFKTVYAYSTVKWSIYLYFKIIEIIFNIFF